MRHINTRQIDDRCWVLEVTDGYTIEWTASFNGFHNNLMVVRQADQRNGRILGEVNLKGSSESEIIGDAIALLYNWAQLSNQCLETLNPRWRPTEYASHRHRYGR